MNTFPYISCHVFKKEFTCASFFSGVGGIDLGFEQTGAFKVVYANEVDTYPAKTYELNSTLKVDNRSIVDVKPEEVPDFDIALAGFPCTDISIAGYKKGLFNDDGTLTRSGLIFELLRILKVKQPKVIFLENVKNLISINQGKTLALIIDSLKEIGYPYVKYKVLNAMEFGNIPQNRERVYILAFKDKESADNFSFPNSQTLTTKISDVIDFHSKLDDKYYYVEGKYKDNFYQTMIKGVVEENVVYKYCWKRRALITNKKGLIFTITANQGTGGHNVFIVKTKHGIRKMTPRECFKAQGFPDSFILPFDLSDSRLYKQAGNSVCVPVIRHIAFELAKSLED